MSELILFTAPGSCSRVPTIALEAIGVPFETRTVRFMAGEHKSADYRRYNPKGKVPTLLVDGEALTENVAIIGYLNTRFPDAALLPPTGDPLELARQIADLCFCSATLHPLVRRIRLPWSPEPTAHSCSKSARIVRSNFDIGVAVEGNGAPCSSCSATADWPHGHKTPEISATVCCGTMGSGFAPKR